MWQRSLKAWGRCCPQAQRTSLKCQPPVGLRLSEQDAGFPGRRMSAMATSLLCRQPGASPVCAQKVPAWWNALLLLLEGPQHSHFTLGAEHYVVGLAEVSRVTPLSTVPVFLGQSHLG